LIIITATISRYKINLNWIYNNLIFLCLIQIEKIE
jgi:hypothetical protein